MTVCLRGTDRCDIVFRGPGRCDIARDAPGAAQRRGRPRPRAQPGAERRRALRGRRRRPSLPPSLRARCLPARRGRPEEAGAADAGARAAAAPPRQAGAETEEAAAAAQQPPASCRSPTWRSEPSPGRAQSRHPTGSPEQPPPRRDQDRGGGAWAGPLLGTRRAWQNGARDPLPACVAQLGPSLAAAR